MVIFIGYRLVVQYTSYLFYTRQGIPSPKEALTPLFGHLLRFARIFGDGRQDNEYPATVVFLEDFKDNQPDLLLLYISYQPLLVIRDPYLIE